MRIETLEAHAETLGQDLQPVFVTDLLVVASPEDIDSWISGQGPRPRFGLLPRATFRAWRHVPVLVVPLNGSGWVGRTDRTLMGSELHAHALIVRAQAGRPATGAAARLT